MLSAGQEQLVAFARILVRDPHVVILDEATARMDPVTEARVQRATERLLRGRIGIVIAHRLSSVRRCDEVVVLADGEVVEAGPLRDVASASPSCWPAATPPRARRRRRRPAAAAAAGRTGRRLATVPTGTPRSAAPTAADRSRVAEGRPAAAAADQPPARTLREIFRLATNDPRYGLAAVALFVGPGAARPGRRRAAAGSGPTWSTASATRVWPAVGIVAGLLVAMPTPYYTGAWFPEWWVRQMLRISLRLVHGQTGPRRVSTHTPAEVVAQGGDTERVVDARRQPDRPVHQRWC